MHQCAYLLENVPLMGNSWSFILGGWQHIRAWIRESMLVDVVIIGSQAHQFWCLWINITPLEVIQRTYQFIPRSPTCLVDDILDHGCHSCVVCHDDQPPLVMVNKVGLPQVALLTFLNFPCSHAFRDGGQGQFGTPIHPIWRNPMQMNGNMPWGFTLAPFLC